MIPCEPFSAEMKCPICCRMFPHLVEFVNADFILGRVFFLATCANCQRVATAQKEMAEPFEYKCDFKYWEEMAPLEDLPCQN